MALVIDIYKWPFYAGFVQYNSNNTDKHFSYIQENSVSIVSPEVNLAVTIQDLPQEKVPVKYLKIGAPGNLSIQMEVFPEPQKDHYEWIIEDKSTNTENVVVKPGL
jgi:hypothetical protein